MDDKAKFIDDPEKAFEFLKEVSVNARFVIDKIWENAKFFTTITSAVLTFSVAVILTFIKDKPDLVSRPIVIFFLAVLPSVLIIMSFLGIMNLRREYRRFLQWVAITRKLYEIIGFAEEFSTKVFPHDKYIMPSNFLDGSFYTTEDFVEKMLKKKNSLIFYFNWLHRCYMAIGLALIFFVFQLEGVCK